MVRQIFFILLALIIFTSTASAQGKKIIYVPIDNRPVNLYQVLQVADKLDYEILTPPEEILGSKNFNGDPDKLWTWLNENAPAADYAVLSTDSLIYGGLVASRMHNFTAEKILERAQHFKTFHEKFPYLTIHAFGTIMRTPRTTTYHTEPTYYATHGAKIFQYTALLDKQEMNKISRKELRQLKELETQIPKEYLDDWFDRRNENFDANKYLIDLTRQGVFEYFLIGCDDSAIYSQTHRESRKLTELASDMGKTVVQVTSGADELGMLMIARAINKDMDYRPFVSVEYNIGKGAETFPTYCNEPIGISIDAAIIAAGGLRIPAHERANLVLAVNTRENGKTFDASDHKKNKLRLRGDLKPFMAIVKDFINKDYPVAIADISFANGADRALMNQLKENDLQFKIRAYGGWNTATNSSGFVIGAGVLTKFMNDKDVAELLITRYLDDWAYQTSVRTEVTNECYRLGINPYKLDDVIAQMNALTTEKITSFAAENLIVPRKWSLENLEVNLPWFRVFECDPRFNLVGSD
ncbi:MAG: DUF4127 family protein [Selenomonadaceae bacterium]|nr:DUF4127 family protein [Selenomonadaceae bacterium]